MGRLTYCLGLCLLSLGNAGASLQNADPFGYGENGLLAVAATKKSSPLFETGSAIFVTHVHKVENDHIEVIVHLPMAKDDTKSQRFLFRTERDQALLKSYLCGRFSSNQLKQQINPETYLELYLFTQVWHVGYTKEEVTRGAMKLLFAPVR